MNEQCVGTDISAATTVESNSDGDMEVDLHLEWLNALNHRNISDVSIASDGMLLNRIIQEENSELDFNYLPVPPSGNEGDQPRLHQKLQSRISEVRSRRAV